MLLLAYFIFAGSLNFGVRLGVSFKVNSLSLLLNDLFYHFSKLAQDGRCDVLQKEIIFIKERIPQVLQDEELFNGIIDGMKNPPDPSNLPTSQP